MFTKFGCLHYQKFTYKCYHAHYFKKIPSKGIIHLSKFAGMKLKSIQFLKAVAVILIVYAYSIELTGKYDKSFQQGFYHLKTIGFIGIDLLFVIVGFLTMYTASTYAGFQQGVAFLKQAFYRINPLYYLCSFILLGVTVLNYSSNNRTYPLLSTKTLSSLLDTSFILPLGASMYTPFMIPGWILSFVWLFLLLFFVTIITKTTRKLLLLTCIIVGLSALHYVFNTRDIRLSFLANPILLDFLFGAIICHFYLRNPTLPLWASIVLITAGITGCIALVFFSPTRLSDVASVFRGTVSLERSTYWGITSGCLLAGCLLHEKAKLLTGLWDNKLLILTGKAFYSIYLVQTIVFGLLTLLYHYTGLIFLPDVSIFLQLLIAWGTGIAFYQWIERPLTKWLCQPGKTSTVSTLVTSVPPPAT